MFDAHVNLAYDMQLAGEEKVVVLMNASGKRIFNWNDTTVSALSLDRREDIIKTF